MKSIKKKVLSGILIGIMSGSLLVGCSSSSSDSGKQSGEAKTKTVKFLSIWNESTGVGKVITDLTNEYKKDHPNFNLEMEVVQQTDLDQKLNVLAASNDLPDLFVTQSNTQLLQFIKADQVIDLDTSLPSAKDALLPTTVDGVNKILGKDKLYALPTENNIEGMWYNKKIFKDNNLEVPKTVDELLAVCQKLKDKGIQPMSLAGKEKWPITRQIANIAMRKAGVNSIADVNSGKMSYTDPAFVEAAKTVQDMGTKGYFGDGTITIDYNVANDTFLNGKAAIYYMGSWATRDFNDEAKNTLGKDGIGFFSFPGVAGGKGSQEDYLMNFGTLLAFSKGKFDDQTADWAKYIASNFGDYSMNKLGNITGFKLNKTTGDIPVYTKLVTDEMKKAKNSGLWMEYNFDQKTSDLAQNNSQLLLLGKMTPEDYCKQLNDAVTANLKK